MPTGPPELELLLKLDLALQLWFPHPPRRPRYGIYATDAESDLSTLYVELRFLRDHAYCCLEPEYHIPINTTRLRPIAAVYTTELPEAVRIRWHVIVEPGVILRGHASSRREAPSPHSFEYLSEPKIEHQQPVKCLRPEDFTGVWTSHHPGGWTEIEYRLGVPEGIYRSWNLRGVCLREGHRHNGQWHSTLITHAADGTLLDVAEFVHGTGLHRIFNSNKQLTDETYLHEGKLHGTSRTWSHGHLILTRHFENGLGTAANVE